MLRRPQLRGVKAEKQFWGKGSPDKGKIQRKHQEDKKPQKDQKKPQTTC